MEEETTDQPLRVYLMDNDLASCNRTLDVLQHAPWIQFVGGMSNPEVDPRGIPELTVDAVFLDVEVPGMSGFEFLERLPVKPAIVIVAKPETEYLLKAFRVGVADFVSKPVSREDLIRSTVKAGIELGRVEHWVPREAL